MSDGPHRTLPMRRRWKALAKCADAPAYSKDDVAAHVCPALAGDWIAEVSPAMLDAIGQVLGCDEQSNLFSKDKSEFEKLRRSASSPMEALLADNARDASEAGLNGQIALERAIGNTLCESAVRRTLQAEEHFIRKSHQNRASKMRARLQEGITTSATAIREMAHSIAIGAKISDRGPQKRKDLEDGVTL